MDLCETKIRLLASSWRKRNSWRYTNKFGDNQFGWFRWSGATHLINICCIVPHSNDLHRIWTHGCLQDWTKPMAVISLYNKRGHEPLPVIDEACRAAVSKGQLLSKLASRVMKIYYGSVHASVVMLCWTVKSTKLWIPNNAERQWSTRVTVVLKLVIITELS